MRISSPPMRLRWEGWQSDAATLGRYGWEAMQEERPYDRGISLTLYHRHLRSTMKTETIPEDLLYEYSQHRHGQLPEVQIQHINFIEQRVRTAERVMPVSVTLEPQYYHQEYEDFDPVSLFEKTSAGLLVPVDTVPDLLARITDLQEPARQERLRERVKQRARDENTNLVSAQIINFNGVAG